MSILYEHIVSCRCGSNIKARIAETVNADRSPILRERILSGRLHRTECFKCGRRLTVEKPFIYSELNSNLVFAVFPKSARYNWPEAKERLLAASDQIPAALSEGKVAMQRLIFGMDELREKLIAIDAGLDDRLVEVTKVLVLNEHPFLLQKPRLRLTLNRAIGSDLVFLAEYEHHPERFEIEIPRDLTDVEQGSGERLRKWVERQHKSSIFGDDEVWINLWRWSPQPSALMQLRSFAQAVRHGETIKIKGKKFKRMLKRLPTGNHLPPWAKGDLATLFDYAKNIGNQSLQDRLFEIRFSVVLEDDWSLNEDPDDIDTLWQLLRDLPDNNVEGNTFIREIKIAEGEGGGSYYSSSGDILIGEYELYDTEGFDAVVRHEIGHAVHEQRADLIDNWMEGRFGWRTFYATRQGIDTWVELMGGWGPASEQEKVGIRQALRRAVGPGEEWEAGPRPMFGPGHIWNSAGFGPRIAFEQTGSPWYEYHRTWHRHGGKAFSLNYWYGTFLVVDDATLDLVDLMPDPYASMSHYEFFAELYALYHDLDDPRRQNIPDDVADWMETNIGAAEPSVRPAAADLHVSATRKLTDRPRAKAKSKRT